MSNKFTASLKSSVKDHNDYFRHAKKEIAIANLHSLRTTSIATTVLLFLFIYMTPFIIPAWSITIHYILFIPCSIAFMLFSLIAMKRQLQNTRIITAVSILFKLTLISFLVVIDIFPYPDTSATFTPLLLAVCPAIFILPYTIEIPFLLAWEASYILLAMWVKPANVVATDTFGTLVGLLFGLILSFIITRLRINDYKVRTTYKSLSQIDALTGLLNKYTCETAMRSYLSDRKLSEDCALLIVDIDDFKQINDTIGHHNGDAVLAETGRLITDIFEPEDIAGRFGGDEFLILIKHLPEGGLLGQRCQELIHAVSQLQTEKDDFSISCSIGVVRTAGSFLSYDDMFRLADDALYEAKTFGKNRFVLRQPKEIPADENRKYMLVVDDQEILRAAVSSCFSSDYIILEATNGHEALSLLSQYAKHISIVLLDIYMDDMDGIEVLRFMKSRMETQRIPVIVITGDPTMEEKVLSNGADDMICKPIDPAVVRLRINKALRTP